MADAEAFKAQGNKALQGKDFDGAIEAYSKAIELDPKQHVYYSNRSAAYLSKGEAEKALDDADQCIKANPSWPKGYSRKGAALHSLKRYKDAAAAYEEGLAVAPDDAALKSGLEDVRKAEEASTPRQNPFGMLFSPENLKRLEGHPKFGRYYADPGFRAKAEMMRMNPGMAQALLKDQEMMEVFGFLMGMDFGAGGPGPEEEEPMAAAGSARTAASPPAPPKAEEPVRTEEMTDEEKEKKRRKTEAQSAKERGNKLYMQKDFAGALAAYDEAVSIDPTNMTFLTNKAAVFFEQGEFDRAIKQCEEAVELGRSNRADYADVAKAYVRMGKAQLKKDDMEAAIKSFRQAQMEHFNKDVDRLIRQTEQDRKKREELAYIDPEKAAEAKERGNELFRGGDFVGAIKEYQEATKRDPKNAAYRNNLAAALAKMGDFPGAKEACEKAIDLDPKYVKAWAKKGDVEFFMKEYHKALESYKKGLELEPNNSLCQQGLLKTQMRIRETSSSQEVDQERAAHALADPEIQAILSDPIIRQVLQDLQENPSAGRDALNDPTVSAKIEKLIAAGVLRVGGPGR